MLSEKGKFMRKSTSSNKQEHTETSTEEQLAVIASILRIWWPQRYRHMLSQKGLSPAQMCSAALEVLQPITSWDIQSATDFCKLWVASWLNLDECIILEAAWNCYQNVCPYLSSSEYASRGQHIHQTNNMHRQPRRFKHEPRPWKSSWTQLPFLQFDLVCQHLYLQILSGTFCETRPTASRTKAADYRMCRWIRCGSSPFFDISSTMCVVLTANRWKLLLQQLTCRCQLIKSGQIHSVQVQIPRYLFAKVLTNTSLNT